MIRTELLRAGQRVAMFAAVTIVALLVIGCGKDYSECVGKYDSRPSFGEMQTQFSDFEILSAGYSGYRFPASFQPSQYPRFSVKYVSNWDTTSWESRDGAQMPLTVADSLGAAQYLNLVLATESPEHRTVLEFRSTELYFEFRVSGLPAAAAPRTYRILKSSVAQFEETSAMPDYWPFMLYSLRPDTTITLPFQFLQPFPSAAQLESLLEDLYDLRSEPIDDILSSFLEETDSDYELHVHCVQMVGGDWGMNDEAFLYHVDIRIDKATGVVTTESHMDRQVQGCHHPNAL